ncbi:MAG: helix-turn-helix transcriptional regulator [Sulfuritalea sp.]|nr:helix-turn-helix transcriptional regulator [Sulfuritalea sp.]
MPNLLGKTLEAEKAFGLVLRQLRRRAGLSQEALAFDAELDRNYISLLELGRNSASVKTIFKLAPALGISVTEFMGMVETRAKQRSPGRIRS